MKTGPAPIGEHKTLRGWAAVRFAGFCLAFYGIPVLLGAFGAGQVWRERERQQQQRLRQKIEQAFALAERARDTESHLAAVFSEAARRAFAAGVSARHRNAVIRHVAARFRGWVALTVLDGRGEVIRELSHGQPARVMHRRLFAAIGRVARGNRPARNEHELIRGVLGRLIDPERWRLETLETASYHNQRAFVFCSVPRPGGVLIAHVDDPADFEARGLLDQVEWLNRRVRRGTASARRRAASGALPAAASLEMAVIVNDEHWTGIERDLASRSQNFPGLFARLVANPAGFEVDDGYLWGLRGVKATTRLLASLPIPADRSGWRRHRQLLALLVVAFALVTVATALVVMGRWQLYLSIRLKLILLFAYSAGMPLTAMGLTARSYLIERRAALEDELFGEIEQGLRSFDRRMPQSLGATQRRLRLELGAPVAPGADLLAVVIERCRRLIGWFPPKNCTVVDASGRICWDDDPPQSAKGKSARKLLGQTARNILAALNGDAGDPEALAENPMASTYSAISGMDAMKVYGQLARKLGRLAEIKTGDDSAMQFQYPVLDAAGRARYLVFMGWSRRQFERAYVLHRRVGAARKLPDTRLWACNRDRPHESSPRRPRHAALFGSLRSRLQAANQSVRARHRDANGLWLLTGVRGQELAEYDLLAMTADVRVRREIEVLEFRFRMAGLGLALLSVAVGVLLARSFLVPVRHLAVGVEALRRRRFDQRIPVVDRDELGDLSHTFNEMMEGLADLEVGRIVQESLFPADALRLGPVSVYGSCISASQVGGDYFDYYPVGANRLAIVIGDVSGHGVGAAMVMGMAKALMAHLVPGAVSPAKILNDINRLFLAILRRKKMMSCYLGLLDLETLRLTASNAGHNFPYRIRAGRPESLPLPSFPLGTRSRFPYTEVEVGLQPGDTVLFYTDGLVEAVAHDREQIGYERFERVLPGLVGADCVVTERAIRDWHREVVAPGPQADDITVVILQIADSSAPVTDRSGTGARS